MIRPDFRKRLMDQRGAAVILWSLFMMSVALYLVIARNVLSNPKFAAGLSLAETLRILLWGLAVVDLGYFAWWKKHYLTRAALLDRTRQAKLFSALEEHKGPVEERAAFVVSTYVTRKVVLFAIIEALAVYGLVLAIVGRYFSDQYLLSALTLILLTLEFPSQRSMEKALGDLEQAT
jgi:hypothetical protein